MWRTSVACRIAFLLILSATLLPGCGGATTSGAGPDPSLPVDAAMVDPDNGADATSSGDAAVPGDAPSLPDAAPADLPPAPDAPAPDDAPSPDATYPCAGVTCPAHAHCEPAAGAPACVCDSGYRPAGGPCERDPAAWTDGVAGDAAVSPSAVVVPDAIAAAYSVLTNEIVLPVAQAGGLAAVQPGTVLVGPQGRGFLRKVIWTKVEGDQLIVHTGTATFEDLFQTADFGLKIPLGSGATRDAWIDEDLAGKVLYEGPINPVGNMRVSVVSGYLAFDPGFSLEYRKGFGGLEWLRFGTDGYLDMELQIEATFSWAIDVDLADLELTLGTTSVPVLVAGVPIVFTPELKLQVGLKLASEGCSKLVQSFRMTGDLTSTIEYTAGADPAITYSDESSFDFDAITPTVQGPYDGNGTATAYANLLASVQVYDVAGPYVKAGPFAKLAFDNSEAECSWQLDVGAAGIIGVNAEVFGMNAYNGEKAVFSVEKALSEGPCACDWDALYACAEQASKDWMQCHNVGCAAYGSVCSQKGCFAGCDEAEYEARRACLVASGCWDSPGTGAKNFLECLIPCEFEANACYLAYAGQDWEACAACASNCITKCNATEGTEACDLAAPDPTDG